MLKRKSLETARTVRGLSNALCNPFIIIGNTYNPLPIGSTHE